MGGRHGRSRSHRGQTLIEFALVAPLALFFLLAIVDFGIAIDRRLVLDHAVREGARYASVGKTQGEVEDRTAAQSQGIADPNGAVGSASYIEVCYENINGGVLGDKGDDVQVRVHYRHDFVTGFTGLIDSGMLNIPMNPKASARLETDLVATPTPCGSWPPP